jgi:uncharacterized protein (UPF0332 family)
MAEFQPVQLDKAVESLAGATSELITGRYNNAGNRAYYATFEAAVYAVEAAGFSARDPRGRWSHEGVQDVFARELITRRKLYPSNLREVLSRNFLVRQSGDYGRDVVSEVQAARAVARAREFLQSLTVGGDSRR